MIKPRRNPAPGTTRQVVDPTAFVEAHVRLEDGRPVRLYPFQSSILRDVLTTLGPDGSRRFNLALVGMGKKNSKSFLAACVAAYLLVADGEPEPEIYGAAASKDQARVVFSQTTRFFHRSPFLSDRVTIYKDAIELKDGSGVYRVLSADAPSQHGLNPHGVIFDEVWAQGRSYDLWEALQTAPTRKQPLTFSITYSGYDQARGNLLWDLYQRGLSGADPRMFFRWFDGDQANPAPWITTDYLHQQAQRLPDHIFRRLHKNEWTSGSGSFLTREDVDAATFANLGNKASGTDFLYFGSIDLGWRKDSSVVSVVHRDLDGHVVLDHIKTFTAPTGGSVSLQEVEAHVLALHQSFRPLRLQADPTQAVGMVQRLRERGVNIEEKPFSGQYLTKLTANLLGLFKERRIKLFEHDALASELVSVKVVERSYGFRIDHESGHHDDHVIALAMASLAAVETPTSHIYQRLATIREGQGGHHSVIEVDGHQIARFALNDDGSVRAILSSEQGEQSAEYADREQFAQALRSQHGGLRFVYMWG